MPMGCECEGPAGRLVHFTSAISASTRWRARHVGFIRRRPVTLELPRRPLADNTGHEVGADSDTRATTKAGLAALTAPVSQVATCATGNIAGRLRGAERPTRRAEQGSARRRVDARRAKRAGHRRAQTIRLERRVSEVAQSSSLVRERVVDGPALSRHIGSRRPTTVPFLRQC
jgi:hypothetical protein